MTASAWATLLITFAVAISSPGPDTFMLLRLGVRSRKAALLAALGVMIGNTVWVLASVLGLSALLVALPAALTTIQLLGSAVLIWMGTQSIRGGLRSVTRARAAQSAQSAQAAQAAQAAHQSTQPDSLDATGLATGSSYISDTVTRHPIRLGAITNLSNPKALLFFTALFSQMLPAGASWLERTELFVALTVLGLAWFLTFAWLASSRAFQRWFGRITPLIDIVAGVVFILVAGAILLELALPLL